MRYKFTLLVVLVCICSVWAEAKVKLPLCSFGWNGIAT